MKLILTHDSKRGKKLAAMGDEVGLTVMSLATLQGMTFLTGQIAKTVGEFTSYIIVYIYIA